MPQLTKSVKIAGGGIVVLVLLAGGFFVWRYLQTFESTDDAEIDGTMTVVSPRIGGTVAAVYVNDQQQVKAGQLIAELDARDFEVAVKQAEARVAEAQAQAKGAVPQVPITNVATRTTISTSASEEARMAAATEEAEHELEANVSRVRQAEAVNAQAQADLQRYQKLVEKEEVSRQDYDAKVEAARSAAAALESAHHMVAASQKQVDGRKASMQEARSNAAQALQNAPQQVAVQQASVVSREAAVKAAQAALDQAKLNLEYAKIFAPITGQIGHKAVEVGMRVQPGQQLMAVVPAGEIWITANFKETQVARMREGQRCTISVDAFDRDYEGYVESLSPATGARFSILPPENTSGNYVKVVQRVPVRLRLKEGQDPEHRLRRGMSVVPKVWLQ